MFSFHSDAAGCLVEPVKGPASQTRLAQKPSARAAAAMVKRKLGADAPTILTERNLSGSHTGAFS